MEEAKNKLYVGNLSYGLTDALLKDEFAKIGEVTEAVIITDRNSGRSKGFGFVTMSDDATAEKALNELNGKELQGRELKISIARPKKA